MFLPAWEITPQEAVSLALGLGLGLGVGLALAWTLAWAVALAFTLAWCQKVVTVSHSEIHLTQALTRLALQLSMFEIDTQSTAGRRAATGAPERAAATAAR